ncbi:MAG TPA: hypothetical protein VFX86_02350 [Candidatus Saccharimonadales bacterium]|nr:hypothetical protein [Candidatus Saccharimonadales bacterium]
MDKELKEQLDSYKVPAKAVEILENTRVVFLVGVSGAGKNTILKELLKTGKYKLVISHTTRKPRKNHGVLEKHGEAYHFIDEEKAKEMLKNNEFIEAKIYSGNIYGTSIAEVEDAHRKRKIAISDIEVQGVSEYMKVAPSVVPVFILPPDFNTWRQRLKDRFKGLNYNWQEMKTRLSTAKAELTDALSKDYFEFVVNDDLERAVSAVDKIAHGELSAQKNEHARRLAQDLLAKLDA